MSLILSPEEIRALTDYSQPTMQLEVLHRRGFYRAYMGRRGVILERGHYDAIVSGKDADAPRPRKVANLSHLRPA